MKKIRNFSCIFVICFSFLIVLSQKVYSDTIYLKNGDIISGNIITLSDGFCLFKTKHNSAIKINSSDLKGLSLDDVYEIKFITGDKVNGKLIVGPNNETILKSTTFSAEINPAEISSMIKLFPKDESESSKNNVNKSFGEKAEQSPPLDFLTGSTVLLSPGIYELDVGLYYKNTRTETSLFDVGYFQRSAYKARRIEMLLTGRAGLYDRLEGWLSIKETYTYIREVSTNEYVRDTDSYDFGDISLGLQYLLIPENENHPAISIQLGVNIPTGQMDYYDVYNKWKDPLNNGSGHWGASLGFSFVRTIDPVILFGGINYNHSFEKTIDNYDVDLRWSLNGNFGVGFALNEKISLGCNWGFGYSTTMVVDDVEIKGSDTEPMDLSFSASYRFSENWTATPQVTMALNDDAGTSNIYLQFARRY